MRRRCEERMRSREAKGGGKEKGDQRPKSLKTKQKQTQRALQNLVRTINDVGEEYGFEIVKQEWIFIFKS